MTVDHKRAKHRLPNLPELMERLASVRRVDRDEKMQVESKAKVAVEVEVEAEGEVVAEQEEEEVLIAEKEMGRIEQRGERSCRFSPGTLRLEKGGEGEEVVEEEVEVEHLGLQLQLPQHESMTSRSAFLSINENGRTDITIYFGHTMLRNTIGFCHYQGTTEPAQSPCVSLDVRTGN